MASQPAAEKTALMSRTVYEIIYYGLWFAHPVLQLAVAGVMFHRKLNRKFPVFFGYAFSQVVIFSLVFASRSNSFAFFYTYWITEAISLGIGFWVIYELFLDVFQPYHTLKDLGTVLFKWAGLVMLLAAGVVAAASPVSYSRDGPLIQAVFAVQRCVRVIQCGLILFLLLFSRHLGVNWKQKSFGISLGFGAFAAVELFVGALLATTQVTEDSCAIVNMIAYNLSILVWLGYMWAKEKARDSSANLLMSQRWEQSFMDLQHPMPADSLIPMFENMVEQAISRVHDSSAGTKMQDAPPQAEQTLEALVNASLAAPGDASKELANSAAASGGTSSSKP